jgi:hypothetical protein
MPRKAKPKNHVQEEVSKERKVITYLDGKGKNYRATRHELLNLGLTNHDLKDVVEMGYVVKRAGGGYFLTEKALGELGKGTPPKHTYTPHTFEPLVPRFPWERPASDKPYRW